MMDLMRVVTDAYNTAMEQMCSRLDRECPTSDPEAVRTALARCVGDDAADAWAEWAEL